MHEKKHLRIALILLPTIILPALGALVGIATANSVDIWYDTLQRSVLTPPGRVFGIVWTGLYILMGVSLGLVLTGPDSPQQKKLITLFIVQLALNLLWSFIFFHFHLLWTSVLWIVVLITMVVALVMGLRQFHPVAALLLLPYCLWLCFAFYLSLTVAWLN